MPAGDRKRIVLNVKPHESWDVVKLGRKTYVRHRVKVLKLSTEHVSRYEYDLSGFQEIKHASRG